MTGVPFFYFFYFNLQKTKKKPWIEFSAKLSTIWMKKLTFGRISSNAIFTRNRYTLLKSTGTTSELNFDLHNLILYGSINV